MGLGDAVSASGWLLVLLSAVTVWLARRWFCHRQGPRMARPKKPDSAAGRLYYAEIRGGAVCADHGHALEQWRGDAARDGYCRGHGG